MAFKAGKDNIVSQQKAEIARLEAEITRLKQAKIADEFIHRVMESTFIILANKPLERWPDEARIAFRHEESATPTSGYVYRKLAGWGKL